MGVNYFQREDRDLKFVLTQYLDMDRLLSYQAYQDFSLDDFTMVIDEAIKVGKEVLGPVLQDGDRQGCTLEDGLVRVPPAFHPAWQALKDNGWIAVSNTPLYGGQGLPAVIGGMVAELFMGANLSLTSYAGLTVGAARLIENFGTEADHRRFLENMYSGRWCGTMCLTEPDAGSDVGWLRSKAVPDPEAGDDRVYKIEGVKRFISCGDHDLGENIIHLLLARIEGAPAGTKGISLFIVPKIWVNPDGSLGRPNDVICTGIEHKMGVHGKATCSLSFGENGGCRGILLGKPHSGMAKMFQMMNEERLGSGLMGQSLAASAYDVARIYAKERVQGPPITDRKADRVPIIQHEDVRRMLMNLKAGSEGMRGLIAKTFWLLDVAEHDPDQGERARALAKADLLTPVIKAYCSDFGFLLTREAIQVLGGVGYCREFPAEQYMRDSKIISIWEGTSYIQALDLVGRKLPLDGGRVFQETMAEVMDLTGRHQDDPELGGDCKLLFKAARATGDFAMRYMGYFQQGRPQLIALTATRFLECLGEVLTAQVLLEQALIAQEGLAAVAVDSGDGVFYRGKVETAKYFCRNILVNVFARHVSLGQEDTSAIDIPEQAF